MLEAIEGIAAIGEAAACVGDAAMHADGRRGCLLLAAIVAVVVIGGTVLLIYTFGATLDVQPPENKPRHRAAPSNAPGGSPGNARRLWDKAKDAAEKWKGGKHE